MSIETLERAGTETYEFLLPESGKEKRPYSQSLLGSLALHIVALFVGGAAFVSGPQYGIDRGSGGMEIQLVAAPVEMDQKAAVRTAASENRPEDDAQAEMKVPSLAASEKKPDVSEERADALRAKDPAVKGDGSAPIAGLDATTFFSPGGASMEGAEGYMKNPAPPYPQAAIELGQEGLVLVDVLVSREGSVKEVQLKEGSGFPLLDRSAVKTLRKWKFSPGRVGFMHHDSWVTVPVRFRLEDANR